MKVLLVEPLKHPRTVDIPPTLEAMQKLVGGYITAAYFWDDPVALIADEEGLLKPEQVWNRTIDKNNTICGNFFICGIGEEEFTDLPDEFLEKYRKMFWNPELFFQTENGLLALRLK